jgi:DNA-binding NtrC family response regulator
MSAVYGIVMKHSGYIDVSSEPGKGTVISVFLNAVRRQEEILSDEKEDMIGGRETILIIDDEPEFSWMLKSVLQDYGYTALIARTAREGIEIYRESRDRIDLVVLDMIMPEIGGEAVFHTILQDNPEARILLMSGHADETPHRELIQAGAEGFIGKPFEAVAILKIIRELLADGDSGSRADRCR